MCNIPIYFYNHQMKHIQHTSETAKTLSTYKAKQSIGPFIFLEVFLYLLYALPSLNLVLSFYS